MNYCMASTGDGHDAVEQIGELWYCQEHGDRFRALQTPPKNLDKTVRKLRRMTHTKRVRFMARLSETDRIHVSKRLAGG